MTKDNSLKSQSIIPVLFLMVSTFVFLIASTGHQLVNSFVLGTTTCLFFIGIKITKSKSIELPKYFWIYLFFLTIYLIHYLFFGGKFELLLIFTVGAIYWVAFLNFKTYTSKYFDSSLLVVALCMTYLYLASLKSGTGLDVTESLYRATASSLHNHLGDIFAVSLLPIVYKIRIKFKPVYALALLAGFVFIGLSFSRSAVVSFALGSLFIFYSLPVIKSRNVTKLSVFLLLVPILVVFGLHKSIFTARPYYTQAISLFLSHPYGIGVGNFSQFYPGIQLVHSLLLEFVSGLGVFSIIFLLWIYKVIKKVIVGPGVIVHRAIFLAITANLILDRTYIVPSMVWIWFASLALTEPIAERPERVEEYKDGNS